MLSLCEFASPGAEQRQLTNERRFSRSVHPLHHGVGRHDGGRVQRRRQSIATTAALWPWRHSLVPAASRTSLCGRRNSLLDLRHVSPASSASLVSLIFKHVMKYCVWRTTPTPRLEGREDGRWDAQKSSEVSETYFRFMKLVSGGSPFLCMKCNGSVVIKNS